MKKRPFVSILVPVYNVSQYLHQCLYTLTNQTLKNIEIVCVNDGSTDNSLAILQEYAKLDDRIKIVDKPNGGLPSARNAGLDVAQGVYVGFVDSDDFVDLNMFSRMYNEAISKDADIVVCGGFCYPNVDVDRWLDETLSPRDVFYPKANLQDILNERGSKPFLWRNLVRKDLIDKYHIRLKEDIVIGEDMAFQFKIYPLAKRVAFISDRLYYYRNSRPDSLMNNKQYNNMAARLLKHVNLIKHVGEEWKKSHIFHNQAKQYFEWSIDLIYWDIIKLSANDKIKIAKEFLNVLLENNYYNYKTILGGEYLTRFNYIRDLAFTEEFTKPRLTIAIVSNSCEDYLKRCLDSIFMQEISDVEVVIHENAANETTKNIIFSYLEKEPRIRLYLHEWQTESHNYNNTIAQANGDYIIFMKPYDWFSAKNQLCKFIDELDDNPDIDLIGLLENEITGVHKTEVCQNGDFRHFIYRINVIKNNNIKFSDYSMLTGAVFFTKYCVAVKTVKGVKPFLNRSISFKRDRIYAQEAKLIMEAFLWLLKAANEQNWKSLARRVTNMLNSENYVRLLTDSTYGFYLSKDSINNEKEDFHAAFLGMLIEANKLAVLDEHESSILKALSRFVALRHSFLEGI